MFGAIKDKIKKRSLKKKADKIRRRALFKPFSEMKSCLVVWENSDIDARVVAVLEKKIKHGSLRKLRVITKSVSQTNSIADEHYFKSVSLNDFNIQGDLKNAELEKLFTSKFDLILDLTTSKSELNLFTLKTWTNNLFSSYKDPLELADICIEDSEDQFDFINKIIKTLTENIDL